MHEWLLVEAKANFEEVVSGCQAADPNSIEPLQAVVRGPSLTGGGKRPLFIPAHHADLLTGIGPAGARMEDSRTRPFGGRIDGGDISRGLFRWPIGVAYGRPLTKPREIGWFQEGPFGNLKFPLSSSPKQFRASPHE